MSNQSESSGGVQAAPPSSADSQFAVRAQGIWKVFGRNPERVLEPKYRDLPKKELQRRTGCVVGLRDVNLEVKAGELFVLMGLSGSGKSTMIRTLLRLVEPTSGTLHVDGKDVGAMSHKELLEFRRNLVSMVFQGYGLLPHYTVLENAAYGLRLRGDEKAEREAGAMEALKMVGLGGWENYYPASLSGGMQQRVGLARALAKNPDILLMDEPFSGLDPLIRRQMQDELVDLQEDIGKTIIFVTHDLPEALKLGDRIAIMRDGQVIQVAEPEEILSNPFDEYVRAFTRDASPARVFTASTVMEEPEMLLYRWQGPLTARTEMEHHKREWSFVVDRKRVYLGVATRDVIERLAKEKRATVEKDDLQYLEPVKPDVIIEDLFGLVSSESYPLPVTDEQGKLLGVVRPRAILNALSTEENDA
ncbi:MAG: glycine betaine/L-proline ABC transporter ATP-binding protein [Spirochaetaceae bacterium]|nr:MAG: glycine betaine/L-proline ABC transporter ATP-binding protein [Spirochaetaceae bacterium]